MSEGDGLLYDGEHIFYCITHGAVQRVDPVDKCVVTRRGEERAECEFVNALVGGRVVTIDRKAAQIAVAEGILDRIAGGDDWEEWADEALQLVDVCLNAAIGDTDDSR